MYSIPKIDNEQLSSKAQKILLNILRDGTFTEAGKLPPEEILAQSLGISRTVIRDVLANLENEGFITRRRGIGTIINQHVLKVNSRLDLEKEFLEMVAEAGYEPSIAFVNVSSAKADEDAMRRLNVKPGEDLIIVDRLILADDMPAIYCIDHIPKSLVVDENYSEEEMYPPIFEFLTRRCNTDVVMDLTEIKPWVADERLGRILGLNVGTPLLHLDEVGFNIDQKPVLWSKEYYRDGVFDLTVLRKKI